MPRVSHGWIIGGTIGGVAGLGGPLGSPQLHDMGLMTATSLLGMFVGGLIGAAIEGSLTSAVPEKPATSINASTRVDTYIDNPLLFGLLILGGSIIVGGLVLLFVL